MLYNIIRLLFVYIVILQTRLFLARRLFMKRIFALILCAIMLCPLLFSAMPVSAVEEIKIGYSSPAIGTDVGKNVDLRWVSVQFEDQKNCVPSTDIVWTLNGQTVKSVTPTEKGVTAVTATARSSACSLTSALISLFLFSIFVSGIGNHTPAPLTDTARCLFRLQYSTNFC